MTRKKPDAETASKIVDLFDALKASFDANPIEPATLPTSRDYPEQFAAGMQALIGDEPPAPDSLVIGKQHRFRAGDVVQYKSGDEWSLLCDEENGYVPQCGYPDSLVGTDSVILVAAASDAERLAMLKSAASLGGKIGKRAQRQLEAEPVDPFDSADYYDCGQNPEDLTHTTPEEAMAVLFSECQLAHDAIDSVICERNPLTVAAYRHVTIPDEWFGLLSERLASLAAEDFDDTELLCNPNGGSRVTAEQLAAGAKLLEPALRAMFRGVKPWHCERVATREYSAEQVEAILRECRPEWFAEDKP